MRNEKYEELLAKHIYNERTALGYMLQSEDAAILAIKLLTVEHFAFSYNRYLFKAFEHHINRANVTEDGARNVIDAIYYHLCGVTDGDWRSIAVDETGSRKKYISDCLIFSASVVTDYGFSELCKKIKEQSLRRSALHEYRQGIEKILNTADYHDFRELLSDTVDKINSIIDDVTVKGSLEDYKTVALDILHQQQSEKIYTGYKALDEILGGIKPTQLIVIGAATSVGKSAFAINLALNICSQGHKVVLWSFEMDETEIFHRIFAIKTGFSSNAIKNQTSSEEHYNSIRKYIEETSDEIKIITDRIENLNTFYLQCKDLKLNQRIKVIIIDYLQLIHLGGKYENNRVRELEKITNTLKTVAMESDLVIIALSQLSREVHKRKDQIPVLSDLRDSGSIEQDANVVIFLYKSEQAEYSAIKERIIEISVAKNRNGKIGVCRLKFNSELTKFSDND